MVNEGCEGQRQERPWYRFPAMLMCKPFDAHRQRRERRTEPSKKHVCSLQSFPRDSWSGAVLSGGANDQKKSGTCCSRLAFRHSIDQINWLLLVNLRATRFSFKYMFFSKRFCFCLCSSLLLPLALTPPACRSQHASVCRFETSPRVTAKHPFQSFSSVPHHTHRTASATVSSRRATRKGSVHPTSIGRQESGP